MTPEACPSPFSRFRLRSIALPAIGCVSALTAFALTASALTASALEVDPDLPHYEPRPFTIPADAGYVRPDGSIFIAGNNAMNVAFKNLNELFVQSHPGTKFTMWLPGTSVGIGGITFNLSAFAPLGRDIWPVENVPFHMVYKRNPVGIRIGHGSYTDKTKTAPVAICVNPANPIDKLTNDQVASIFTVGNGTGDITRWGQLGLTGEWAPELIHLYGSEKEGGLGLFMQTIHFGGHTFSPGYEEQEHGTLAVTRVEKDPAGICLCNMPGVSPKVKVVAIADHEGGYYSKGSYEDVRAGKYPYNRFIYIYINRSPDKPLDPFVKEYLRMVLSREGQAALSDQPNGFLPLSADEANTELRKLD
jgi:phosphate transport system substrate-binding protein